MNKTSNIILTWFLLLLLSNNIIGQNNYAVKNIPDELKKNAKAVIRMDNNILEIHNDGKAILSVKYAITILNKNGIDHAVFRQGYNKFLKLDINKATVYDENGKKIKRIPKSDILDFSAISGFSTYEDDRIKVIDPEIRNYPFTVEYEYQLILKGTLFLPPWMPYSDFNLAVQHSEMKVILLKDVKMKYLEKNLTEKIQKTVSGSNLIYTWSANNLLAITEEPFSGDFFEYIPSVKFALNKFSIAGNQGDASTWNSFGKWVYELNREMGKLPAATEEKLRVLVKNIDNDLEKIRVLYNYMQNNTRYVSIQVGIGGWQSLEAEAVDRLGYGDCKALSNYMQSILKSVGIESYYTIINAGQENPEIDINFPSNQFNHVILCVPNSSDTVWLECTSQDIPCGYLGSFTDDRYALVIKESGGELVHTPTYSNDVNIQSTNATVSLSENGNGSANIKRQYKGVFYDKFKYIYTSDDADKKKLMYQSFTIPQFNLISFDLEEYKYQIPEIIEESKLELANYATLLGESFMFDINLMNKVNGSSDSRKERLTDIVFKRSTTKIDTICYVFPSSYKLNSLPKEISLKSEFGNYETKYTTVDGKLMYVRKFELKKGIYSKNQYPSLVNFLNTVSLNDNQKIIVKKVN